VIGRAAAMLVRLYQLTLGRLVAPSCRFSPSCSEYAIQALRANGFLRGGTQAALRILRCNPFTRAGVDEVPQTGPLFRLARPKMRTHSG
jgi:uncharacterized protein